MKVSLPDIETYFPAFRVEEAMELVKHAVEYAVTESEPGHYQIISSNPSFHVEIQLGANAMANAMCHCQVFRKTKTCKHALAAMVMLRDQIIRQSRPKTKTKSDQALIDETLRKLSITSLRRFVADFARSHASFRAELLAQSLYLTRKPDYAALFLDITPIDKHGQIKINRNNLKVLRGIISTLLKQAQQLLREKALPATFQIIEPTCHHLQRLMIKFPAFQPQLSTDLKLALRIFDMLCHHAMAPRLQDAVIKFAFDLSQREGHVFLKGLPPVLRMVDHFVLEQKARDGFFHLAQDKVRTDLAQQVQWQSLMLRWMRMWKKKPAGQENKNVFRQLLPDVIVHAGQQQEYEDVLYALPLLSYDALSRPTLRSCLLTGLRAARSLDHPEWITQCAKDLSVLFFDLESWDILHAKDPAEAEKVIREMDARHPAGSDEIAEEFILSGLGALRLLDPLFDRLAANEDIGQLMAYDHLFKGQHSSRLIPLYVISIQAIREKYGGVQARQKLNNIFTHLKSIDLYSPVAEQLKAMEKGKTAEKKEAVKPILGFVFDLDGVIVDTAVHHFQAWKKLFHELGVSIAEEDDDHTRGASRMESLEYLLNKYGLHFPPPEKEVLAAKKNSYYLQSIESITPDDLLPGALAFLQESRRDGLRLALGSASKNARGVLEKLGIEHEFDAILDGNDAQASKPDPEIFTKACDALQLDPSAVVVFEDAAKGVQAAIAAGCHVVGLGDPVTLRAADLVIPGLAVARPAEIIEQLV